MVKAIIGIPGDPESMAVSVLSKTWPPDDDEKGRIRNHFKKELDKLNNVQIEEPEIDAVEDFYPRGL